MDIPVPDVECMNIDDLKGLRLGVPEEYFIKGIQPEVEAAVQAGYSKFGNWERKLSRSVCPHTEYALPVYYLIAPAEASANLARYD